MKAKGQEPRRARTPTNPIASAITYVYTQNKNGTGTRSDRLKWVGEHEITYDTVGNPLTYYNGSSYEFTWRGRQLTSAAKNGGTTTYFTYSDEGLRTSKSRGTYEVKYYYSNGLLIGESDNTQTILYIYDAEGSPLGMRYRTHAQSSGSWTTYWFEKNLQGDIVAVYNSAGTKILSYKYDAWGNFTGTTNATDSIGGAVKNPFRYRGYYYDSDLGFYVTGTRYYDPVIGRFISPDAYDVITATPTALTDKNLYAYCDNNPVMRVDYGGMFWETLFDVASLVASAADVVMNPSDAWAWVGLVGDVVDLVPFVSGVGEATDLLRFAGKVDDVADAVDDVHDTAKAIGNFEQSIDVDSDFGSKVDFYITPNGEAIPASRKSFDSNLSKLQVVNGKYVGGDSQGPIRIRVEQHHASPNYSGPPNPFHTSSHFHIDRRKDVFCGPWNSTYVGLMEDLYK